MQVVGYDSGAGGLSYDATAGVSGTVDPPALLIAEDGAVRREPLEPGRELDYGLDARHCAGTRDGESHEPCAEAAAPYCDAHAADWPCARCSGQCGLPIEACREEHAVYLAAFAPDVFKVGVTRVWRLATRLREQGAARAAHVHTVSDGRIARRIEAEMATALVDRVPTRAKVAGLHRPVDDEAWETLLSSYAVVRRLEFAYDLSLDARPVAETLATGRVRGTRGRLLVLDHGGSTYAVDLRDLVGYDLATGGTDRDLQSSLGAFG